MATTVGQEYRPYKLRIMMTFMDRPYKLRIMMTFMEVTNRHKGWPTSRSQTYIKHVTMVLYLEFSVQLIVSLLTLLIVKLGGDI